MSASTIRRVLGEEHGYPDGCTSYTDTVETYSRDYPGMQAGYVTVCKFAPSTHYLRELVLAARADSLKLFNKEV